MTNSKLIVPDNDPENIRKYIQWITDGCPSPQTANFQTAPVESDEERAKQDVHSELQKHYGDAGIYAAEGMCLLAEDYMKGFDHCVGLILPALEEELSAQNGDLG